VAISLDEDVLAQLDRLVRQRTFRNRSKAIEQAVKEKLERLDRSRLARECAKLDPAFEKALADEGLSGELAELAVILRGEVVWADLNPRRGHGQAGMRPVVVLSHDIFNQRSGTVIAMAVTSQPQRADFPLTMELEKVRLPKRSWVKISQIRTLSVDRLGRKLGRVTPEELDRLVDGLIEIVGS